jgi:exosortase A-associated hydrolase 1
MNVEERAIVFSSRGEQLLGILHEPLGASTMGVVIVVGGPQYRAGSHRHFVLLARALASKGLPVMRFDQRGMGDSDGPGSDFNEAGPDIRSAIDQFFHELPSLQAVVLFGLCDGASAALLYAPEDPRVTGLVLLNPWVRSETTIARAYLKHYYLARLFSRGMWQKVLSGGFDFRGSILSFVDTIRSARRRGRVLGPKSSLEQRAGSADDLELAARLLNAFTKFAGRVVFILSSRDLTAAEFKEVVAGSTRWRELLAADRVDSYEIKDADHALTRREWQSQVIDRVVEFVQV